MKLETVAVLGVLGVGVLAAVWVWRKGGVVQAVGSVASGTVGAIGATVGLPMPDETTTDASVARYLIDVRGLGFASRWAGLPALASAAFMQPGTGRPPAPGSAVHAALIASDRHMSTGDFARIDRASSNGAIEESVRYYDPMTGLQVGP